MYCERKECDKPLEIDDLIEDVDEMTINPCPCTQVGNINSLSIGGDCDEVINIKYCPLCGRKL